ncbi:ABC transporter ATP-binding protein [Rubellimicrobium rubrum]|uniref:ABC transporter ATP-binding protein n=1 Tax=Rubellimicrobium rubrum TaxID=2585369 RepID=A0A5C4MQL1_9RHOB|nr:ABC transporter ATP-binding protein [Rubellimicrobium rubrum]TNC47620.1 ABC transporter ATP-binding protein [Rubellimicrobium rubrum]
MGVLALSTIRKDYGETRAVDDVTLDFPEGELTALLGPSGCGKTTLLRMIAGLEAPSRGTIALRGRDITQLPAHRRKFGMVFQNFALFPHLSVRENVAYALTIGGTARAEAAARADRLLDLVQLSGYGDRRTGQLSGGQRQRVAIARALAQEPEVFLLDEPMSALDAKLREEMQVELRLLQQRLGITTIVVTHDQREAMTMADRIVVMSAGRVEQAGSPQDIYRWPATAFVAGFIGRANFMDGVADQGRVMVGDVALSLPEPVKFLSGSPVRLTCRPEAIRLEAAGVPLNRVQGTVTFVRDLGPVRDIHLDTVLGKIVAEQTPDHSLPGIQVGQTVHLTLPPEALRIYPRPRTAMAAA